MTASVYKICVCRDRLKCRHPWWFSFKRPKIDQRIRKSLDVVLEKHIDSKTVAEQEADRLRVGIVDDKLAARTRELLGLPPSTAPILPTLTVAQLLETYRERYLVRTATSEKQTYQIGAINRTIIAHPNGTSAAFSDWLVVDVTADALERLREVRMVPGVRRRAKGSHRVGGTVAANRDLRLLRAAFNWALDKDLVERTPFKRGDKTRVKLSSEHARSRRLQAGEGDRLLAACGSPRRKADGAHRNRTHLRALVEAALETGCRRGELLSLQWRQVEFEPRPEIWLPKTKTGKPRRVPISTRLRTLLEMRREALRATLELTDDESLTECLHVFGNEIGQPVHAIKTAWRLACSRAKITDLHFHDLRREAGSRWMEAGVPLATIQKWLGHTNIAQTSTYLATTTVGEHEAMRRFEERVGRLTPIDTDGGTPPHDQVQSASDANKQTQQSLTKH